MKRWLLALALLLAPLAAQAAGEPNIIVILVDDTGLSEISSYGTRIGAIAGDSGTPNIDALATAGVRFTNAVAVTPKCAPSRATLYTGLYPNNHGMRGNVTVPADFWLQTTIPGLLQDSAANYTTGLIGKSHLGPPPVGDPWDHFIVFSGIQGTYENTPFYENSQSVITTHNGLGNCASLADYGDDVACYVTDEITRLGINWIASIKDNAGPFFLVLSHKATHGQYVPAIRHTGDLTSASPALPATFNDTLAGRSAQVQAYTTTIFPETYDLWTDTNWQSTRPGTTGSTTFDKDPSPGGTDQEKKNWAGEQLIEDKLETMMALDESVDTLRDYLAATEDTDAGVMNDETVIIFVSDNGIQIGGHGLSDKDMPFSESIRIPLIMAGKGITGGQVKSEIVTMADVASTILDMANVTEPATMPGRTLFEVFPTVTGGAWRTSALIWSTWEVDAAPPHTPWYALYTASWILVNHYDVQGGITPAWELIDRSGDETTNVYSTAANLATRETLRDQLRAAIVENGMTGWTDTRLGTQGSGKLP